MKKNTKKFKFTKNELMFPDLTQIKLEQAQLKAHVKTTEHIGKILDALILIIEKIKNIENHLIIKRGKTK